MGGLSHSSFMIWWESNKGITWQSLSPICEHPYSFKHKEPETQLKQNWNTGNIVFLIIYHCKSNKKHFLFRKKEIRIECIPFTFLPEITWLSTSAEVCIHRQPVTGHYVLRETRKAIARAKKSPIVTSIKNSFFGSSCSFLISSLRWRNSFSRWSCSP